LLASEVIITNRARPAGITHSVPRSPVVALGSPEGTIVRSLAVALIVPVFWTERYVLPLGEVEQVADRPNIGRLRDMLVALTLTCVNRGNEVVVMALVVVMVSVVILGAKTPDAYRLVSTSPAPTRIPRITKAADAVCPEGTGGIYIMRRR